MAPFNFRNSNILCYAQKNLYSRKEKIMNKEELRFKCIDVAGYWNDKMPMMTMEEAGELIQAISKMERCQSDGIRNTLEMAEYKQTRKNLVEEIGDMFISLTALMEYYNIDDEEVDKRIKTKLNKVY